MSCGESVKIRGHPDLNSHQTNFTSALHKMTIIKVVQFYIQLPKANSVNAEPLTVNSIQVCACIFLFAAHPLIPLFSRGAVLRVHANRRPDRGQEQTVSNRRPIRLLLLPRWFRWICTRSLPPPCLGLLLLVPRT